MAYLKYSVRRYFWKMLTCMRDNYRASLCRLSQFDAHVWNRLLFCLAVIDPPGYKRFQLFIFLVVMLSKVLADI